MPTVDKVIVELEARLDRYEANVARAEQKFDRAMGGIQKSAGNAEKFVSRAAGAMAAALAGVSAIALAKEFLQLTDTAKQLEAQLRLSTRETGSFAQAQEDVTAFLVWTAEPKLVKRVQVGWAVFFFLLIFTVLTYFSYRNIWADKKP